MNTKMYRSPGRRLMKRAQRKAVRAVRRREKAWGQLREASHVGLRRDLDPPWRLADEPTLRALYRALDAESLLKDRAWRWVVA